MNRLNGKLLLGLAAAGLVFTMMAGTAQAQHSRRSYGGGDSDRSYSRGDGGHDRSYSRGGDYDRSYYRHDGDRHYYRPVYREYYRPVYRPVYVESYYGGDCDSYYVAPVRSYRVSSYYYRPHRGISLSFSVCD